MAFYVTILKSKSRLFYSCHFFSNYFLIFLLYQKPQYTVLVSFCSSNILRINASPFSLLPLVSYIVRVRITNYSCTACEFQPHYLVKYSELLLLKFHSWCSTFTFLILFLETLLLRFLSSAVLSRLIICWIINKLYSLILKANVRRFNAYSTLNVSILFSNNFCTEVSEWRFLLCSYILQFLQLFIQLYSVIYYY